jgi:hypothetical protein
MLDDAIKAYARGEIDRHEMMRRINPQGKAGANRGIGMTDDFGTCECQDCRSLRAMQASRSGTLED